MRALFRKDHESTTYGPRRRSRRSRPGPEGLEDRKLLHPKFIIPLGGVAPYTGVTRSDWSIVNYVDLATGPGVKDYRGGDYTYDGHRGVDMTLPNFAAEDKGVSVFAAADGKIIAIKDDVKADHNTTMGAFPVNYVAIDHGGGWVTYYYHLRFNSVPAGLHVGQAVHSGDKIGLAGSSGSSTMGHLHFEVQHNGVPVETFLDPAEYWVKPLPYAGDTPGISDAGVSDHAPTTLEWQWRPKVRTTYGGPNAPVDDWAYVHGIKPTDVLQFRWSHDGTPYTTHTVSHGEIRFGGLVDGIRAFAGFEDKHRVPADWAAQFVINGKVVDTEGFVVNPGVGAPGGGIQADAVMTPSASAQGRLAALSETPIVDATAAVTIVDLAPGPVTSMIRRPSRKSVPLSPGGC
jgi:murein DD-endopeptidase MepM/ murein hydrolase activator NlpD